MTSSIIGLIALQIGIMFGILFFNLIMLDISYTQRYEEIIKNQEIIISIINGTNYANRP